MHDAEIIVIGSGNIGGKASGLKKVKDFFNGLSESSSGPFIDSLSFPQTAVVATDVFNRFVEFNKLEGLIAKVERADYRQNDCEKLRRAFMEGEFPDDVGSGLLTIVNSFESPVIVRSSSLLEDQKGAAFAGKYESVFVGNQGEISARKKMLFEAIKKVYSTTYNPNALEYRSKHGFFKEKEAMAVVIQGVVGRRYKHYYLPAMAGVAFSQNGYCWNKDMRKEDGLVRLVFGLGTRAVGRGYVRLFSPPRSSVRPEGTDVNNIQKCSQKKVDVVDLENNDLKTVHFRELINDGFDCYPNSQPMVSLRDGTYLYKPVSNIWDNMHVPILTMDGVLHSQWMKLDIAKTLSWLLKELESGLGFPVDVEFAINVEPEEERAHIYILQTRPLSQREGHRPEPIPILKEEDTIISVRGNLPTSYVPNIEYLVYVDDIVYHKWPHKEKQTIARTIGKLNEILKGKRFALIGPGRWGSWNPDLGVPVNYSEISNCLLLVEVARRKATYVPEVSFGSHFFQDLIEDNIAYLPVYPDNADVVFNDEFFQRKSDFNSLLTDDFYRQFDALVKVVHVPSIRGRNSASAVLNGEVERAVLFVS